jgi:glycerol-3-phosphate dehydrogenase (NAD(P)+)
VRIAILGAGAWGTALAISFSEAHDVRLWTRQAADREALRECRRSRYLPQAALPAEVALPETLEACVEDADLAIIATSTPGLSASATALAHARRDLPFLWACKGFGTQTRRLPHEVVAVAHPTARCGVLSGPSFALEVARGQPTAVVVASRDEPFAHRTASELNSVRLRFYSSGDLVGVELGGAIKNVIAIAAGISDGLELGNNARAALVTRGLAEIVRLGLAMGGQAETFMGLAGLGDLVLTCTGALSRNREVGVGLAHGETLERVLARLGHVAEGVHSAPAVRALARERHVDMPIVDAVCRVLFEGEKAGEAVRALLSRDPRRE